MPGYIDPLHPGGRNERIQYLQGRYQQICREQGMEARSLIHGMLGRLDPKVAQDNLEAISWNTVLLSHKVAKSLLESPEFRPLVAWYVADVPNDQKAHVAARLEDMGALEYQRVVREGGAG